MIERHSCWDHTYEDCAVVVLTKQVAALTAALAQHHHPQVWIGEPVRCAVCGVAALDAARGA